MTSGKRKEMRRVIELQEHARQTGPPRFYLRPPPGRRRAAGRPLARGL
jgi:hypothetical protein